VKSEHSKSKHLNVAKVVWVENEKGKRMKGEEKM